MLHMAAVPKEDVLQILFAEFPSARKDSIHRSRRRARARHATCMKQRSLRILNVARSKRRKERRERLKQEREEHDVIMPRELRRMAGHDRSPSSYWSLIRRDDSVLFSYPDDDKEWREHKKMAGQRR